MKKAVLDTSALLAAFYDEPGGARILDLLATVEVRVLMSAVNLSEAQAVLVRRGLPPDQAWAALSSFRIVPVPFGAGEARLVGSLIAHTEVGGISFGDRACLSLAMSEECVVLTADQAWEKLTLPITMEMIRVPKRN